jgi:hypothetical protein
LKKFILVLGIALFLFANDGRHFASQTVTAGSTIKLNISLDNPSNKYVYLHYRTNNADLYSVIPLKQMGYEFSGSIKIPEEGYTGLEYYFSITDNYGNAFTQPEVNPEGNPYTSRVVKYSQDANIVYEILAPFEGEQVAQDDFMIALSLLSVPVDVNLKMTKVLFDGVNVTKFTEVAEEIITWVPVRRLKEGTHNIDVEFYNNSNELVKKIGWSFTMTGDAEAGSDVDPDASDNFQLYGSVDFNTSAQNYGQSGIAESSQSFTSTSMNLGGNLYNVDYTLYALISSEQEDYRQNIDRLSAFVKFNLFWGMYMEAQFGDFTPDYNSYMLSAQNMRGVGLGLVTGLVNLRFATGENRKEILPTDSLSEATINQSYQRDFIAGRFSIGKRERGFGIGLNFLSSKDKSFENDDEIMNINPEANIVLGPDFTLGFLQNRIKFSAGFLLSLKNENIRGGALPLSIINEEFGTDLDQSTYDQINNFFPFTGIPLVSKMYYTTFDWNYANVLLRLRYEKIDADYKNHGNPYIQDDVKRLVANTTIRLLDNSLYLRGSLTTTEDNVSEKQALTTSDDNMSFGFDWYPNSSLPTIGVSFSSQDQSSVDTLGADAGDYTNNSYNVSLSKQFEVAGFNTNSMIIIGSGTAESKLTPSLGSETSNFLINSSAKFPFIPLKVFAEFSTFEAIATDISKTNTNNIRLNGTYEILSSDDMNLSGFAQYVNSGTDFTLEGDETINISQNAFEFGGNLSFDLTPSIAMTSFVRYKTIAIANGNDDYTNSYFSLGASLAF